MTSGAQSFSGTKPSCERRASAKVLRALGKTGMASLPRVLSRCGATRSGGTDFCSAMFCCPA